ncbi:MAG: sulfite exporter TauE/SafE family protein [Pirellulales bacterium]|nr:sulfite exporter TauE/SafE family protein [Pirellulales bacterium]
MLPLLAAQVGVTHAVPLLTVAQLVGNLARAGFGFTEIHWKPVGLFLLGAIPLSVLGAVSFVQLPKEVIARAIGAVILVLVALTYFGVMKIKGGPALLVAGGGLVGFLSGLAGSAGPLGAAVFLSLGLPPVAYVASEATTALAMHGVKTLIIPALCAMGPRALAPGRTAGRRNGPRHVVGEARRRTDAARRVSAVRGRPAGGDRRVQWRSRDSTRDKGPSERPTAADAPPSPARLPEARAQDQLWKMGRRIV